MNRAVFVAAGILISRVAGFFIRARVFTSSACRTPPTRSTPRHNPNFLQNLFGEGALSASFIPVYASLVSRGKREEADRVAGAVFALVTVVTSVLVLIGVLATPQLIAIIAPGFTGEKRELAISLTRILFPGTGMLVLSAWCFGILNSHHRFALWSAAPVMVNAAMISTMVYFGGGSSLSQLAEYLAWGAVVGSALQFGVQLPVVFAVAPDLRISFDTASEHVRTIARNFVPAFISRGVVQLSAYIDSLLASLLPTGAVTGLTNASLLYTLPVSLFGVAVAASELPAAARAQRAPRRSMRRVRRRCGCGSTRGCGALRSSLSPRRWRSSHWAISWPVPCCRPGASRRTTPCTCGPSLRVRRWGWWRRRWGGCIRPPAMRCGTRARRCASRWCESSSLPCLATRSPFRCRTCWALAHAGARRG